MFTRLFVQEFVQCVFIYTSVYVYIYIYIERERERERESKLIGGTSKQQYQI